MPKVFYVLMIMTVVIVVLGGIFLWSSVSEDLDIIPAVKVEPPENYKIIETAQGISVENSNVGLKFKVPEGWTAEKEEVQADEWVINVLSPDIKFGEDGMLSDGCGLSVWVEQDEITANVVRYEIADEEAHSENNEKIEISSYSAMRITIGKEGWGEIQAVKVPIRDMVLMIDTLFRPNTEQRCSEVFNQFLEQVEIK